MESTPQGRSSLALLKSIKALGKNTKGGLKILKKPSESISDIPNQDYIISAQNPPHNFEKTKEQVIMQYRTSKPAKQPKLLNVKTIEVPKISLEPKKYKVEIIKDQFEPSHLRI